MIILFNTITKEDRSFVSDLVDTNKLTKKQKTYFENLDNGYLIESSEQIKILGEDFDVGDYCYEKLPKCMMGDVAKIDKILNILY